MNILLTEHCNKNCSFCLVADRRVAPLHMSTPDFDRCLRFAEVSGERILTLLGGEPTTHPKFDALVERARARGFRVVLLSNFLFGSDRARTIHRAATDGTIREFLVNADFPEAYSAVQWEHLRSNLARAPASPIQVTLAVTVRSVRPLDDYSYLREYYRQFDVTRIRVALDVRALVEAVGRSDLGEHYYRVVRFLAECGFAVGAELCAVARCMFTEYQHDYLRCHCTGYDGAAGCEPNLDVFPDLTIAYCAARPRGSVFRRPLADFATQGHARSYFRGLRDDFARRADASPGAESPCAACPAPLRDDCALGCLSPWDHVRAPTPATASVVESAPAHVRVLPLASGFHVWVEGAGAEGDSFAIDAIGMDILAAAWRRTETRDIAAALCDRFDVAPDQALSDVQSVMEEARARGALP